MGRLARLRSECRRHLRDVSVPDPFDLAAFCAGVARRRGRPLHLHELPTPAADVPCGLWLATGTADHIFHAAGTTALHRQHIVLHEIAHLLCDHASREAAVDDLAALLLPDLDPAMVLSVLRRTSYEARHEQLAEMMASLIVGHRDGETAVAPPTPELSNLADAFGLPRWTERRG